MKLIKLLSDAGIKVFVAYCSTEFILWKYAGAKEFATGKFLICGDLQVPDLMNRLAGAVSYLTSLKKI